MCSNGVTDHKFKTFSNKNWWAKKLKRVLQIESCSTYQIRKREWYILSQGVYRTDEGSKNKSRNESDNIQPMFFSKFKNCFLCHCLRNWICPSKGLQISEKILITPITLIHHIIFFLLPINSRSTGSVHNPLHRLWIQTCFQNP